MKKKWREEEEEEEEDGAIYSSRHPLDRGDHSTSTTLEFDYIVEPFSIVVDLQLTH